MVKSVRPNSDRSEVGFFSFINPAKFSHFGQLCPTVSVSIQAKFAQIYVVNIIISDPKLQDSMESNEGEDCLECNEERCSIKRQRIELRGESS